LCDNESGFVAKVSGHSRNDDEIDDNNIQCCDEGATIKTTKPSSKLAGANNLNFARVSLKTIKSKIKLNGSYSLTLLPHQADKQITGKHSNLTLSNEQDKIVYNSNCNAIDGNNKSLIKSKSITGCLRDGEATKEVSDEVADNRTNSISNANGNHSSAGDRSMGEDGSDELCRKTAAGSTSDDTVMDTKSSDLIVLQGEAGSREAAISSSSSNEDNNEIIGTGSGSTDDEKKLLNINHKRNTNPFLNDIDDQTIETAGTLDKAAAITTKAPQGSSMSWDEGDSDELCNSEVFGAGDNHKSQKPTSRRMTTVDDPTYIIKSAIPTCSFQRQDYQRPSDGSVENDETRRDKKLFKLSKKLSILTNGKSSPSLKNVNLHYPDKTSSIPIVNGNERKYFGRFHSKAKYQLIKLGQKCKILTHHHQPASTLPSRVAIMKTNTSHRKKYQHYNEINKSYQLDDFIRSTHLLDNESFCHDEAEPNPSQADDSVVYKSYKSEIDLTRNLTYLDAFLNEHFERDEQQQQQQSPSRRKHHQRVKSGSRSANHPTNVIRHDQQAAMINGANYDDEDCGGRQFADGNVTSSSFEYTAVRKARKDLQEAVSGKSNTTSSSLSSSDYASVYSGGSKEGRADVKSKLISTPEESIECHDEPKPAKQKRMKSRRASQPIPEHTNADCDQYLLFDEANFTELKNNMKKFHPDLYNSVPQFEDLNAIDFYENPQYHQYDGETLINPYAAESTPTNKRQLSSSYNDRAVQHQDYLEHFQQQMVGHDDIDVNSKSFYDGMRHRTSTMTNEPCRDVYFNQAALGSANDLYDARKISLKAHSQSMTPYGHPHRVIVSKSKKQRGELVLEYEC
jgi:hypothetical protein